MIGNAIKQLHLQQKTVAGIACIDPTNLNRIIKGQRPVDADSALRLEMAIGLSAQELLQTQVLFDIRKAQEKFSPEVKEKIALGKEVYSLVPVGEMISRGWLPEVNPSSDARDLKASLEAFFDGKKLTDLELAYAAKKTNEFDATSPSQLAWLGRAKQVARSCEVLRKYDEREFSQILEALKPLLADEKSVAQVAHLLSLHGIRLVYVEKLKSSKIDGACMWLDQESPVVAMSLRYDRNDNYWFVLRHELEHVRNRDGMVMPAVDSVDALEACEDAANRAYENFIDPDDSIPEFIRTSRITLTGVKSLAQAMNLHPGLVIGRIQFLTKRYSLLRNLQTKIRQFVLDDCFNVDGWGIEFMRRVEQR